VLQAHGHADGEAVHQRAEGGALLVHVDEDLAEVAVLVLTGAQEDLVATDARLLREAAALLGQAMTTRLGRALALLSGGEGHGLRRLRGDCRRGLGLGALHLLVFLAVSGWLLLLPSR
jgi:hypothetical protein